MGKKKVMDRITDFLGLYDSDKYDPEDLEELEEDEQEEEEEERKPVPVAKADEPAPEKPKKSFFSRSFLFPINQFTSVINSSRFSKWR